MCMVADLRKAWIYYKKAEDNFNSITLQGAVNYGAAPGGSRRSSPVEAAVLKREKAAAVLMQALIKYESIRKECSRIIDRLAGDKPTEAIFLTAYGDGYTRREIEEEAEISKNYFYTLQRRAFSAFDLAASEQ